MLTIEKRDIPGMNGPAKKAELKGFVICFLRTRDVSGSAFTLYSAPGFGCLPSYPLSWRNRNFAYLNLLGDPLYRFGFSSTVCSFTFHRATAGTFHDEMLYILF